MASIFLTSSATTLQTWSSTAPYGKIEAVGPGGNGAGPQTGSKGGPGGGAGSYSLRNNTFLPPTVYYLLPAAGSGNDAWFNDLNLLLQSQTQTAANWFAGNCSVTSGVTAPDGTTTAYKIVEDTTNSAHFHGSDTAVLGTAQALTYIYSVYVKAAQRNVKLGIQQDGGANGAIVLCTFGSPPTMSLGTQFGTGFTYVSSGVTQDAIATGTSGNGWYRAWIVASCASLVDVFCYVQLYNGADTYTGDGSSGANIWGEQTNYGSFLKPYVATTTSYLYSVLAKAGTNATTSAAGVGQSGGQGDTVNQGGNGDLPASGTTGGGGGGAGGPNGTGSTSSSSTGGAADNSTVAGASSNNAGNSGTEFDGSHGSGSGAGGSTTSSNGRTGGNYGGGGSGSGGTGTTGGTGGSALIAISPLTVPRGHARLDTIGWALTPPDPYPLVGLRLPSNIMAVPVNNPPPNGPLGLDFPWASVPPDPYPITIKVLAPSIKAVPVNNPPAFAPIGIDFPWASIPPDPYPIIKGPLPASLTAVRVDFPPPNGPLGLDLPWASIPPDPYPIVKGPLPASLTSVPVNTPPWPGPQGLKLPFAELPPDPHPFGGFWSLRLPISITAVRVDAPPIDGPLGKNWPWHESLPDPYPLTGFWALRVPCSVSAVPVNTPPWNAPLGQQWPWPETLPDPYPLSGFWPLRVPCSVSAVPVNNPPGVTAALAQAQAGFSLLADMALPSRPGMLPQAPASVPASSFSASGIFGWQLDPQLPLQAAKLPVAITAVPVSTPPFAGPLGKQWPWPSTPPDPYSITKGPLPAALTAVRVDNPPSIAAISEYFGNTQGIEQPLGYRVFLPLGAFALPVSSFSALALGAWQADQPPVVGRTLPPQITSVPVNNPPFPGAPGRGSWPWPYQGLDPYPIVKGLNSPGATAFAPVNNPPWHGVSLATILGYFSAPLDPYPITKGPLPAQITNVPVNSPPWQAPLSKNQNFLWPSTAPDPYPITARLVPPVIAAVAVNSPPWIGPLGLQWPWVYQGQDPYPIVKGPLPAALTAVRVDSPPGISARQDASFAYDTPGNWLWPRLYVQAAAQAQLMPFGAMVFAWPELQPPLQARLLPPVLTAVRADNPPGIQRALLGQHAEAPTISARVLLQWPGAGGFVSALPVYDAYSGLYDWAAEGVPITGRLGFLTFAKPALIKYFSWTINLRPGVEIKTAMARSLAFKMTMSANLTLIRQ